MESDTKRESISSDTDNGIAHPSHHADQRGGRGVHVPGIQLSEADADTDEDAQPERQIQIGGDYNDMAEVSDGEKDVATIAREEPNGTVDNIRMHTLDRRTTHSEGITRFLQDAATQQTVQGVSSSSGALSDDGGAQGGTRSLGFDPTSLQQLNPGAGTRGFAGSYVPGESSLGIPAVIKPKEERTENESPSKNMMSSPL